MIDLQDAPLYIQVLHLTETGESAVRRLSLAWLTIFNATPPELVTAAAAGGFDSVSLRITGRKPGDAGFEVVGNPPTILEIKRRLDDTGVKLSSVSTYHVGADITFADLLPSIETAAVLGAEIIMVNRTDPDDARWLELMARCCDAAALRGMRLALEFVPFNEAKTIDRAVELAGRIGRPNFGIAIDALHLARSGGIPADIRRVDPALIYMGQLCDAARERPDGMAFATEARTGRMYPGDGALPLHDFVDALPSQLEIDCEIPSSKHAHLPVNEQARQTADMVRRFLEIHEQRKAAAGKA
jgi:sugar phosphate isomerase/epimerase